MGATASSPASGLVTVSRGTTKSAASAVDPDLAALRALPQFTPLVKQPTLRGLLSRATSGENSGLPILHGRNVSALCREYASLSRHAALPLCEEQRALAKKMSGVEALCARVLYLMALRSSEMAASAATLKELSAIGVRIAEVQNQVQVCVARCDALDRRLPSEGGSL